MIATHNIETVSFDKILARCKNLSNNELNINWSEISGIPEIDFLLTQKDQEYPLLRDFNSPFTL